MKIATWNVNGIKARLETVKTWLKEAEPDVLCLQEIKSVDDAFPAEPFEELGYNVAVHGQKSFNGVAIFSRQPFDEVVRGLPGGDGDEQARYIETVLTIGERALRVASIYLPNGNPIDTEKFPYKLAWMKRLEAHAEHLLGLEEPCVLAGDYNVIPEDEDVYDPSGWSDDALFQPSTRQAFRSIVNLGLTDAFRACNSTPHQYTFWDFQRGAWQKNHGIRIDHLLLSPQAADRLQSCEIARATRGWEKPSDHVPVAIDLEI